MYDYGFRIYNPRIGKFLSVDPLTKSYPWYTPYQFAGNKPIWAIDLDGLEEFFVTNYRNEATGQIYETKVKLVSSATMLDNHGGPFRAIFHVSDATVNTNGTIDVIYKGSYAGNFSDPDDCISTDLSIVTSVMNSVGTNTQTGQMQTVGLSSGRNLTITTVDPSTLDPIFSEQASGFTIPGNGPRPAVEPTKDLNAVPANVYMRGNTNTGELIPGSWGCGDGGQVGGYTIQANGTKDYASTKVDAINLFESAYFAAQAAGSSAPASSTTTGSTTASPSGITSTTTGTTSTTTGTTSGSGTIPTGSSTTPIDPD